MSSFFREDFTGRPKIEVEKSQNENREKPADEPAAPERVLRGLMKVGLLAHGILKNDDKMVDLVVLAGCVPTKRALDKIVKLVPEHFDVSLFYYSTNLKFLLGSL